MLRPPRAGLPTFIACGASAARRACLRARACNGDLRHCLRALPLVPHGARHFMVGFEHGREDQLTFDEMIDLYAEELVALENWRALVMTSLRR